MGLFSWFHRRPQPSTQAIATRVAETFNRRLRATYDAARTSEDNERYWANADYLSPAGSVNPTVRRLLRARSRYETANNSYATGMMQTLANDVVGAGPGLQVTTVDGSRNADIETAWREWSAAIALASKLRTAKISKTVDGEIFALKTTNKRTPGPVKLDVRLVEADQVASPFGELFDETREVDGIRLDEDGNPVDYHILDAHPGAMTLGTKVDGTWVKADQVIHWFREDRPAQRRGVPELTPALHLFANLRRYTLATIAAAETAADFAAVMYTDQPVEPGSTSESDWFAQIPIQYRSMITLPDGWKMGQFKAEQPTTGYRDFQRQVVAEMARCLSMPYNIAAGDSAEYNYASGRLDHLTYWLAIDVERSHLAHVFLEPLFRAWLAEYLAAAAGISPRDVDVSKYPHRWIWRSRPAVDPAKHASAVKTLWDIGFVSDEDYLLAEGQDPDEWQERLRRSIEFRKKIGAPVPGVAVTNTTTGGDKAAKAMVDDEEEQAV